MIKKLEKNVCKVLVSGLNKSQQGTGFLISNNLIMTAYHVLEDTEGLGEIKVHFNNTPYNVKLHKLIDEEYKNLDVAILKLEKEVDFYQEIDFIDKKLDSNEKWITRGYPLAKNETGEMLIHEDCVIHQHLDELTSGNYDIELNLHKKLDSYSGLSGSPIIVDKCIVGFLTKELLDSSTKEFKGLSFKYFKELIDKVIKKEQRDNTIKEVIPLKNGKSFTLEFVKVELEKDKILYVGKYPVTFDEYDLFCNNKNIESPNDSFWGKGTRPVINISWNDANEYCAWLSDKSDDKIYRLPTSSEWLIIADKNQPQNYIINESTSDKKTSIVSIKRVGSLCICDMFGNVYEWCSDGEGEFRKAKGGSFQKSLNYILNLNNYINFFKDEKNDELGFRVVFETDYKKVLTSQLLKIFYILHKTCLGLIILENRFLLSKYDTSFKLIEESITNISDKGDNIKELFENIENIKKNNENGIQKKAFRYEPEIIQNFKKYSSILSYFLKKIYTNNKELLNKSIKYISELDEMIEYMGTSISDDKLEEVVSKIQKKI